MSFEDKQLTCKECGNEFLFTSREQDFYAEKGFTKQPGRCRSCRKSERSPGSNKLSLQRDREIFMERLEYCLDKKNDFIAK